MPRAPPPSASTSSTPSCGAGAPRRPPLPAPTWSRCPKGTKDTVVAALARIPASERLTYRIHHVRKGDTLSRIALQYHSAPEAILQFNRLRSAKTLRINSELAIPVPSARALAEGGHGLERQVARARAQGYVAPAPDDEVPAGTRTGHARALAQGTVKSEVVDGKTRVQYGVQSGDSLWTIAQRFDVSVEQIQDLEQRWGRRRGRGSRSAPCSPSGPDPRRGPSR